MAEEKEDVEKLLCSTVVQRTGKLCLDCLTWCDSEFLEKRPHSTRQSCGNLFIVDTQNRPGRLVLDGVM